MFSIKTAPAIASISEPLATTLGMGKFRLLQYPFPDEGTTLKIDVTLGQVLVQGSFTIQNPTSLTADFSLTSTTSSIDYFISPDLYQSSTGGLQTSRQRRQTVSTSNITVNVYLSIKGLQTNNTFFLNTTFGDTTSGGKNTRHVLNVHRYDCYYYYCLCCNNYYSIVLYYSARTENSLHTTVDPNGFALCCPAMKTEVAFYSGCTCNSYKHSNSIS